jgi:hypothetical protein
MSNRQSLTISQIDKFITGITFSAAKLEERSITSLPGMRKTYDATTTTARNGSPLLAKPTLRRFLPSCKHNGVTLQAASQIIPGSCQELVFALEVNDR